MKIRNILLPATAALMISGAAYAQQVNVDVSPGLVTVDLSNINAEIAKDINVDVSQIPVTVQAPIGIAAAVCDVSANVLATQKKDAAPKTCDAQSTNEAMNNLVQKQVKEQS